MIAVSIVDALVVRKKKVFFLFFFFLFPLRIDKLQKFRKRFFRSDGIESRKCLTKNVYRLRNFFDSIINNNNNSDMYSDVKNEWGDLLRWFRCYTIITSDSFYLFCKHGKNSPFLHRCVKTEFLFFLFRTVSSTCPTTMFKFYKSIYDRPTLLATRLFSKFRYRLLFTKRDSSVSTVKLRTNTTDLSIYLSIYLKLKIVAFHPLSTKIETSTNAKLRLRFKRSRIYRFPSPRFRALVIEF